MMKDQGDSSFASFAERRFHLKENGTDVKTELLAGLTTFATMSYVLAVVPNMLSKSGIDKAGALTALILMVVICSGVQPPLLFGSRYEFRSHHQQPGFHRDVR